MPELSIINWNSAFSSSHKSRMEFASLSVDLKSGLALKKDLKSVQPSAGKNMTIMNIEWKLINKKLKRNYIKH